MSGGGGNSGGQPPQGDDGNGLPVNNSSDVEKQFNKLAKYREKNGWGKYTIDSGDTTAMTTIDGEDFYGANSSIDDKYKQNSIENRRKWFEEIKWSPPKLKNPTHLGHTQSLSHAEAQVLLQAYDKLGKLPEIMKLYVDKETCNICIGELPIIMRHVGVKELHIYNYDGKYKEEPLIIYSSK